MVTPLTRRQDMAADFGGLAPQRFSGYQVSGRTVALAGRAMCLDRLSPGGREICAARAGTVVAG